MNSFSILLIANFGNINANVLEKQLREKAIEFQGDFIRCKKH